MNILKKIFRFSTLFLSFLLVFIAPIQGADALLPSSDSLQHHLKLGVLPAADSLALRVAADEGLFAKYGLTVELVPFQSALEQAAAVRSGALEGSFCDIITSLGLHESGVSQRIVAVMAHSGPSSRFFGIAVRPGSPLTEPKALQGARIAISRATIIDYMLDRILAQRGCPDDFAERVDIRQIAVRLQLLLAGKVDAALLPEPLLSLVEAKGAKVIADDTSLSLPLAIVALRKNAAHPQSVSALQAGLDEAMRRITDNPESYRKVLLEKKLLPRDAVPAYRMPRYDPATTPLPLPSLADVDHVAAWMVKNGLLRRSPDGAALIRDVEQ